MGLLDDAIREHLELKRKHGADPDEVARQEQEALGPGARSEFAQPEGRGAGDRRGRADEAPPTPEPERRPAPEPSRRAGRRAARGRARHPPRSRGRPRRRATTRTRGSTTSPTRSRPTRRSSTRRGDARRTPSERGRARGDARLPPGDAGARPAVVRAEAAARLRLGQVATSRSQRRGLPIPGCLSLPEMSRRLGRSSARRGPQLPRTALRRVHLLRIRRGQRERQRLRVAAACAAGRWRRSPA